MESIKIGSLIKLAESSQAGIEEGGARLRNMKATTVKSLGFACPLMAWLDGPHLSNYK